MKLIYTILFCIPYFVFCQEGLNESILKYNQSSSRFDKAKYASDAAWSLKDIDPEKSLYYAQKALSYSKDTGRKKLEAYSLSDVGNYYKRKEDYNIALEYYLNSLVIRKELEKPKIIAAGYNQIGLLYKQQEKYDSAAINFLKGIKIVRETDYKDELLRLYDGYAMTLYHLGEVESALVYLDRTFVLAREIEDLLTIAKSVQNKGVINQYLGHNRLALNFYKKAGEYYESLGNVNGQIEMMINQATVFLSIGKRQDAERLLLIAEKQSLSLGFKDNLFIIYMDLGQLYKGINLRSSKDYLQKAYDNAIAYDKHPAQIESGLELGMHAINIGRTDEAYAKIKEIKGISVKLTRKNRFNLHLLESSYWAAVYDFERALLHSQKALFLKDSLQSNLNYLQDVSAVLENERHEKGIALEQLRVSVAEKGGVQAKLSRDRIVFWSLITGAILLILLFIGKKKRLKIEHEKKLQSEHFQTALREKEYESDLLFLEENLILESDIRRKIGRDLHDHLGSKLAVIQITLESLANKGFDSKEGSVQLDNAIDLVDKSCKDVRVISHDLIEHDILKDSLDKLFLQHCKSISNSGYLKMKYSLSGEAYQLPLAIKKHLYTTVILLIDNIIKHAQAHNASLQFFYHNDCINVQLDDDGIGLGIDHNSESSGVGLINAKERIDKIGGTMEIDCPEDNGTFISISIPTDYE